MVKGLGFRAETLASRDIEVQRFEQLSGLFNHL